MKSMNNNIALTALLVAGATFFACSNDENEAPEQPVNPSQNTYTLTVIASKNTDAATRALSLSGSTLNATWSEGDEVKVYNSDTEIGTLIAQNSGASTTLTGNLTSAPSVGDNLTLKFLSPDYAVQEGTLEYIAANCDYATATVTVSTVNTTKKTITTTGDADFHNQQAIVKFTISDNSATPTSINVSKLTISADGYAYTVTPLAATNNIFVAIPSISSKTINLYATDDGNNTHVYSKSSVSFINGKYYAISVKMRPPTAPEGVEAIDLGLPSGTLWANMNVGATVPGEDGDNFAWGETVPQGGNLYDWTTYKYCNGSLYYMTKYCTSSEGIYDGKRILEADDDAATSNWGGDWCVPTKEQYDELLDNTTYQWNGQSGGYTFTSKTNGNSIFLPCAGISFNGGRHNTNWGYYWSSTLNENSPRCPWALHMSETVQMFESSYRCYGYSVRPVRSSN